jgi:UDP-N-acetylglucosamine--N-acetylmuramyl-(pentapeptide) pyrophosphoryl-undecaprenol N-acetylglucosamine transferase
MEAGLVERNGIPFKAIPAAGVHGVGLRILPHNLMQLGRGFFASRRILREFKPDVLFFTGGYTAIPMALAGWKVPSLLYVPDIEPGLALKTLGRFADRIIITAEDSFRYFTSRAIGIKRRTGRIILAGYPTRPDLTKWTRQTARQKLGLTNESPVLLVLGGSKGARSINDAIIANLTDLLDMVQLIHITGNPDWSAIEAKTRQLPEKQSARYHVFPYLHEEIGAALAAADLALSRAGASVLGEYPLYGLPAILVPYPHAWRYQKVNADYLVRRGAAVMLEDSRLSDQVLPIVKDLLGQPQKLASLRIAMQQLSHPEAAEKIGGQILALGRERR